MQPASSNNGMTAPRCAGTKSPSTIEEPVAAAADIKVAATILSGITLWAQPESELTPSITITPSPAP